MPAIRLRLRHLLAVTMISCFATRGGVAQSGPSSQEPVWSVDIIKTLPGMQDEYLRNIEANWAGAREMAQDRGEILSYRALAAEPDSTRGWDVILMTEYADSTQWAGREEAFKAIFESPEFVHVEISQPNSELREFLVGGVTMRSVAP